MEDIVLNNGMSIPWIGLGTYPMRGEECYQAVFSGGQGYRLFDSSAAYGNAEPLGQALADSFQNRTDFS